jgi:hypothetical protein
MPTARAADSVWPLHSYGSRNRNVILAKVICVGLTFAGRDDATQPRTLVGEGFAHDHYAVPAPSCLAAAPLPPALDSALCGGSTSTWSRAW